MANSPEEYLIEATPYVPGSHLLVIVYRGAVSHCQNEDEIKTCLESKGAGKRV
jgi:hypothetical protein